MFFGDRSKVTLYLNTTNKIQTYFENSFKGVILIMAKTITLTDEQAAELHTIMAFVILDDQDRHSLQSWRDESIEVAQLVITKLQENG